jgi:hypothetical protein
VLEMSTMAFIYKICAPFFYTIFLLSANKALFKFDFGHMQDAKKGVLFIDFPPVLQLQLKRFEYDFMRDTMVKV